MPVPDFFTGEFYQIYKEETASVFYSLSQKTQAERTLPNSSCEIRIILIWNTDWIVQKKYITTNMSCEYRCKHILKIYYRIEFKNPYTEFYITTKWYLFKLCKAGSRFKNQCNSPYQQIKNHKIIADTQNPFEISNIH